MRPSASRRGGQSPRYREYARYRCTYRRHHGNAGSMVLSHKRAPPTRATNPQTGGRLTQAPAGTNPKTGQAPFLFNLDVTLKFQQVGHFLGFEVAGETSSGTPTLCCVPSLSARQVQVGLIRSPGLSCELSTRVTCNSLFCHPRTQTSAGTFFTSQRRTSEGRARGASRFLFC